MKIMVLNGSPKRDGSDCMHITRAFLEGMNSKSENTIHILHVIDRHIEYCKGCLACMQNGGRCVIDDDMRGILEEIWHPICSCSVSRSMALECRHR